MEADCLTASLSGRPHFRSIFRHPHQSIYTPSKCAYPPFSFRVYMQREMCLFEQREEASYKLSHISLREDPARALLKEQQIQESLCSLVLPGISADRMTFPGFNQISEISHAVESASSLFAGNLDEGGFHFNGYGTLKKTSCSKHVSRILKTTVVKTGNHIYAPKKK